jgi:hypothetical protein
VDKQVFDALVELLDYAGQFYDFGPRTDDGHYFHRTLP